MPLANIALTDTFDTWRTRTNQIIVAQDQANTLTYSTINTISGAYTRANNANVLAYDVSIAANAYATLVGTSANAYSLSILPRANAWANTVGVATNNRTFVAHTTANAAYGVANAVVTTAASAFNAANGKVATVSGTSGRVTATGTTSITVDLATAGAGASSYTGGVSGLTVDAYGRVTSVTASANYQAALGFTPVRQGGGTGQGSNTVYIGWGGSQIFLQVDSTNFGGTWPINISGLSATSTKASTLAQNGSNGAAMTFNWSGQGGQPSWLWGSNDGTTMYVWNPSNFSVNYATSAGSATSATTFTSTSQNSQFNSIGIGTTASGTAGTVRATNDITAFFSSDMTLKTNVTKIQNALSKVNSINGVEFDWTDDYIEKNGGEDGYFVRKHDIGVIAQEIEKVLPEVVATREDGIKAVKYDRIVPLLIEAIKELKDEIEELKSGR